MKVVLIAILLIISIKSINQLCNTSLLSFTNPKSNICPIHSHCLQNNYCACDSGYIGGCTQLAYQMEDGTLISATVSNLNYTFFSITQPTETYIILVFQLCHTQGSSNNSEQLDVWEDQGDFDIIDQSNALPGGKQWDINQGCSKLSTPLMVFSNQENGLTEKFILGVRLVNQGTINFTLQLEVQIFDFWDLFLKFILILGGIFLLLFVITLVVLISKCVRGRRVGGRTTLDKDISHFQNLMPKFQLNRENRYRINEENCSVCLLELVDGEWVRQTICKHIFHQECIDEWYNNILNCPMCRRSFELKDFEGQIFSNLDNERSGEMRNPLIL